MKENLDQYESGDVMGVLAKGIGIFVVIVIIAIAVGSFTQPHNEQLNEQLNDNIVQVAVADIPSYADKEMVEKSIDASLYRWAKNNPEITFEYATDEYNELFIHWEKAPKEHIGLQEGKSIMIGLGQYDCKGKWQHFSKETLSDTIAHETGHYLGLKHHTGDRHLMYGDDEFVRDPFDTLGYSIPPQLTEYDAYVEGKKAEQRLDQLGAEINVMAKSLGLDKAGTHVATTSSHVIQLHQAYNSMVGKYNALVNTVNCFYEPSQKSAFESSSSSNYCKSVTHSYGSIGTSIDVSIMGNPDPAAYVPSSIERIWCPNPNYKIP